MNEQKSKYIKNRKQQTRTQKTKTTTKIKHAKKTFQQMKHLQTINSNNYFSRTQPLQNACPTSKKKTEEKKNLQNACLVPASLRKPKSFYKTHGNVYPSTRNRLILICRRTWPTLFRRGNLIPQQRSIKHVIDWWTDLCIHFVVRCKKVYLYK